MSPTAITLTVIARGTTKVGRWEYPAELYADGTAARQGKGGQWVDADPSKVVETPDPNPTRALARSVYRAIFANFAAGADEILASVPALGDEATAAAYARALEATGLVTRDRVNNQGPFVWQSWQTYDDITEAQALGDFAVKVPVDFKIRRTPKAVAVTNNTHAKPGHSTWKIGDPCAQGLHALTKDNLYVMPSGRKQCKDCRKGYPSNI